MPCKDMRTHTHRHKPLTIFILISCVHLHFIVRFFSYFFSSLNIICVSYCAPRNQVDLDGNSLECIKQAPWNFKTFLFLYFLAKMFSSYSCDCDAACCRFCCCYGCYDADGAGMLSCFDVSRQRYHGMAYYGIIKWALRCRSVLTRDTYPEPSSTLPSPGREAASGKINASWKNDGWGAFLLLPSRGDKVWENFLLWINEEEFPFLLSIFLLFESRDMNFTLLCKINLTFIDQTLFIERHWEDNDDDNDEDDNKWNWIVYGIWCDG